MTSATATLPTPAREIPSLSHPATTRKVLELIGDEDFTGRHILDLGAGMGYLSWKLAEHLHERGQPAASILTACDLYPENFEYEGVTCEKGDFAHRLPYEDGAFDLVVCMEVIEHVPNQLHLISEMARIVRPGGRAIVTTPNILNINARLRYLLTGTMPLYDVLPIANQDVVTVSGHIGPIHLYLMHYFAKLAGFEGTSFHIDRAKKGSVIAAPLFWAASAAAGVVHDRMRASLDWWDENRDVARELRAWKTFVGRTTIMDARR